MQDGMIYDLVVIGGGSGGIAAANRAASYGAKVLLVEARKMGGTCVNLGCVPKKIMYCAGSIADAIHLGPSYGFSELKSTDLARFDWNALKTKRDAFIKRLNGIYEGNLKKNGVVVVNGWCKLLSPKKVSISVENEPEIVVEGKNVLIATGSKGIYPTNIVGYEYGICSDGFFALEDQPKRAAIVGSGYIGVELAGVFKALGSDVDMFIRSERVLTHFDMTLQVHLTKNLKDSGIKLFTCSNITKIIKSDNGELSVDYDSKESGQLKSGPYDCILFAIGRAPKSANIGLEACGVTLSPNGSVPVDEFQNVIGAEGLHAIGDVTGVHMLTPVAIAAGRKLSDRLFGGKPNSKQDYELIPSVVFSHPPCGAVGLTEVEAREKFGSDNVKVYESSFNDLFYSMVPLLDDPSADEHVHKTPSVHKLVVEGPKERVVGLHIIGRASDEILQGFAVAIKMGATKADFDRCVAIHPTAAEELVTLK